MGFLKKPKDLSAQKKEETQPAEPKTTEKSAEELRKIEDRIIFFEAEAKKKQAEYAAMLQHFESERLLYEIFQQLPLLMPENLKEIHGYIFELGKEEAKEDEK